MVTEKESKTNLKYSEDTYQNNLAIVRRIIDLMSLSAVYSTDTKLHSKLDFSDYKFINAKALRCSSCMISHFPCFKFCCWSIRRKEGKTNKHTRTLNIMSEATIGLVQQRIKVLEEFEKLNDIKNKQEKEIIKSFFKRTDTSCNPSSCPDIIYSSSVSSGQDTKLKLKGGGKDNLKVKRFTSDNNNVNLALNALRSSSLLNIYSEHKKCAAKTLCNFCLLRSIVFKINSSKGRQSLQPVEVEGQLNNCDNLSVIEILNRFIINSTQSVSSFLNAINPVWTCSCCRKENSNTDGSIIFLDNDAKNRGP